MSNISDDEDMLAAMDKSSPVRPPKRSRRAYDDDNNGEGTQDEAPDATGSPDGTLASNSLSDATVLPSSELAASSTPINANTVQIAKRYAKKMKIKPDQLLEVETFLTASFLVSLACIIITEVFFNRINLLNANRNFISTSLP
jgi:hypothetical protein